MERILEFLGFEETAEPEAAEPVPPPPRLVKNNVVSLHPGPRLRLVIARPVSYEQAAGIADCLKEKNPILLNLEGREVEVARRILDFLSGVVYALGGRVQKVREGIFVVTPANVELSYQDEEDEF